MSEVFLVGSTIPMFCAAVVFLLVAGVFVQMHFFPEWRSAAGWLTVSLVIVPVALLGAALLAAYPPLMFLILIIAASTVSGRRR